MREPWACLPNGTRLGDHVTLGVLTTTIPRYDRKAAHERRPE